MEDIPNRGDLSWGGVRGGSQQHTKIFQGKVANTQKFFTQKLRGGLNFYTQGIFYAQQDFINTIYQTICIIIDFPLGTQ